MRLLKLKVDTSTSVNLIPLVAPVASAFGLNAAQIVKDVSSNIVDFSSNSTFIVHIVLYKDKRYKIVVKKPMLSTLLKKFLLLYHSVDLTYDVHNCALFELMLSTFSVEDTGIFVRNCKTTLGIYNSMRSFYA